MNVMEQAFGRSWALWNGDCVDVLRGLPDASAHLSIFSPPFSNLYTYTPTERDMGNTRDDREFFAHFAFLTEELRRVMLPGRIVAVHVQNLPTYETRDGVTGRRDFRGALIRHFTEHGFVYHSEITIDKNAQSQAIRNHPKGLLFVQLERDAAWMWQAYADYLCIFRTPGTNPVPVRTDATHEEWIRWARPVWPDIRETDVLNVTAAKEHDDEKHLCPLQLPVIERAVRLWSNKGETVLDPFTGIGSAGVVAMQCGRRFVGAELKPSYFHVAAKNIARAEQEADQPDLFALAGIEVPA